ncbi:tRNA pseudouridine(13) synthase TruD [Helicobacter sp. 12S02634-8]|uniref:tRNA pseudouridine(13) synthase TruD n=1 Tax=Helicobacter sp. 12S02634-8 TaxID=1476199 RepID=UPI000BA76B42|nr:tRNA pseudouridine(13) synthase TruD [Helicobacter sp. 12S02634-8]PAF48450.1 tRNA pseudouridine(13) synthase TruD [Helicobacter sp. 12S02634-8]
MEKIYAYNHSPIDFYFSQNSRDFMVREVPLYPCSQTGEHWVICVRKKGLSTLEMIKIISRLIGCKASEIGYAGLKDKSATTTQYISIHKNFTKALEGKIAALEEKNIKILSSSYHHNKLKIGHLKGNSFFIRLKKISPANFQKIDSVLQIIAKNGLPNYFGYQRFGKESTNHLDGEKIAHQQMRLKDKKLNHFLLSSYQSFLFNQWLALRVKISRIFEGFEPDMIKHALKDHAPNLPLEAIKAIKAQPHFFKLFEGDLMHHYPHGKLFALDMCDDFERFYQKLITPTGLLSGIKTPRSTGQSGILEQSFDDTKIQANGARRFAWIWAEEIKYRYIAEQAWVELEFFLPKGSYGTTLIEELAHRNIKVD